MINEHGKMREPSEIEVGEKLQNRIQPSDAYKLARYLATVDEITSLTLGLPELERIVAELEK